MKTQVVIIGAGPAGLLLGHLLRQEGIDALIVERRSKAHVLSRIRAGLLEEATVDIFDRLGISQRMRAQGLLHDGINLTDAERPFRIDLRRLTGKQVIIYGQTELTEDLVNAAPSRSLEIIWEAHDVSLHDTESDAPHLTFREGTAERRVDARFIAGCDGYHGPSRVALANRIGQVFERGYPFGWLGIMAEVPPCNEELIYANHENGFALASMRSRTRSRYYVQVPLTEKLEDWPDERVWDELSLRLGCDAWAPMKRGPSIEKSIAPLRSFVFEPMHHGSLVLAGDAAHIVPPTGAKGLNLAASDVAYLSDALIAFFTKNDSDAIAGYSAKALARVWKAERFSWSLTMLMHRFQKSDLFERRMQLSELEYISTSEAAQRALAENYVGLPL